MATKLEVFSLVKRMAAAYPQIVLPEETPEVYFARLQGFPITALQEAVEVCLDECKYFPSIPDIRERLIRLAQAVKDTGPKEVRNPVPFPPELKEKLDNLFKKLNVKSARRERRQEQQWTDNQT